jgi:ribosomal protein S18 acetylase RimI-like enzyme
MPIRRAQAADVAALVALERRAFDPALYTPMSPARFRANVASPTCEAFVFVESDDAGDRAGAVLGYSLGLRRSGADWLRFYSLAVDKAAKGRGIGEALFQHFEDNARTLGLSTVLLEIREDNAFLRERYTRYGYTIYRRVDAYYPDGCACLKMRRRLDGPSAE